MQLIQIISFFIDFLESSFQKLFVFIQNKRLLSLKIKAHKNTVAKRFDNPTSVILDY